MTLQKCIRCAGQVSPRQGLDGEEMVCLNCGYEAVVIPPAVVAEYNASLGKNTLVARKPKFNVRSVD